MANDRIFVVCEWCGAHDMLGKYYPSNGADIDGERLARFYRIHRCCHPRHGTRDLVGSTDLGPSLGLSLLTEMGFCAKGGTISSSAPVDPSLDRTNETDGICGNEEPLG